MEHFLNEKIFWKQFELLIDTKIFNKDVILKTAYIFLDKWYFFFKKDKNDNIFLQFTKKENVLEEPQKIILDFSDELLSTYLRDKLEKDNKKIRETIIKSAIWNSVDNNNFIELNTNKNQIDFINKDIDEIMGEIENDPDLDIDKEEIETILKEIKEKNRK